MLTKQNINILNNVLNDCLLTDKELEDLLIIVNILNNKIKRTQFFKKNKQNLKNNKNKYFLINCDLSRDKTIKQLNKILINNNKNYLIDIKF